MKHWERFEQLVEAIQKWLFSAEYDVERDVKIQDASGATHQIDVLLRPKSGLCGPILVSWNDSTAQARASHSVDGLPMSARIGISI
jgi:hypothetical protein